MRFKYKNKKLGTFGLASSFSFIMVTIFQQLKVVWLVNDKKLSRVMTSVRSHGWLRDIDKKFTSKMFQKMISQIFNQTSAFFILVLIFDQLKSTRSWDYHN